MEQILFWFTWSFLGAVLFGHMIYGKVVGWPFKGGLYLGLLRATTPIVIAVLSLVITAIIVGAINGHMAWFREWGQSGNAKNESAFIMIESLCFVLSNAIALPWVYLPIDKKIKTDWKLFPQNS